MNCVCGHSVFDHAKVYELRQWVGDDGTIYTPERGPTFALSGPCKALRKGESYRACGCKRFQRPAKYAEALRDLQETPMRFLTLAEEAQDELMGLGRIKSPVEFAKTVLGVEVTSAQEAMMAAPAIDRGLDALVDPTKWKNFAPLDRGLDAREWLEWWKKYDRAPEPGPSEVM